MLDELEALGGEVRRVPADVLEVGQDLVVGRAVRVAEECGVAADGRQGLARPGDRDGQLGGLTRAGWIVGDGQAGALEQLGQEVRAFLGR